MSENVRLTLYVEPSLKQLITEMAQSARPKTNLSALGVYLLELGLEKHKEEKDGNQQVRGSNPLRR